MNQKAIVKPMDTVNQMAAVVDIDKYGATMNIPKMPRLNIIVLATPPAPRVLGDAISPIYIVNTHMNWPKHRPPISLAT